MSVRFVLGRSGSGKTWRCLEAVRAALRTDPREGPLLVLLVPEQASLQVERALLSEGDVAGFTRCEVLSFRRLAYRLLSQAGGDERQVISPLGRQMMLRYLLSEHADRLRFFGGVRGLAGLPERLGRTVNELMEQEVEPGALERVAAELSGGSAMLGAKLADMALLYREYLHQLGQERADPTEQLTVARRQLGRCGWLRGARVWVDGFAGFTVQQREFLVALAGCVSEMEIALLMDPGARLIDRPDEFPVEPFDLFARTERTYERLLGCLRREGITVEAPRRLAGRPQPRFARSPSLGLLERSLFGGPAKSGKGDQRADDVLLVEAPNRRSEVAAAVRHVVRLTRLGGHPLRYREVAIILRDLEPYYELLEAALSAHGVPYFVDRREPVAHHPAVELVGAVLELLAEDFSVRAVGRLLKTGLTPLDDERADELENYVLAQGVRGRDLWYGEDWSYGRSLEGRGRQEDGGKQRGASLQRINASRRVLLEVLGDWPAMAGREPDATVREWAAALFALMERMGVAGRLGEWWEQQHEAGRLDRAQEHQQVWRDLVELLDDVVESLGEQRMAVEAFREVVESGLVGMKLALVPPRLDQVLVGSIERSRHPEIKAAVLLGLSDRSFPMVAGEDNVLNDEDREALEGAGVELAVTSRQRLLDERLLGYIAMTRAAQSLWLSWPVADEQGRGLQPSPFLEQVRRAFGELTVQRLQDPAIRPGIEDVTRPGNLAGYMATVMRQHRAGQIDAEQLEPWLALYGWARSEEAAGRALRRALGSLRYGIDASLDERAVALLYGDRRVLRTSVSRLERHSECPFEHFTAYALGLEERQLFELAAVDLGRLYHTILERFADTLIERNVTLAELEEGAISEALGQISRAAVEQLHDELMVSDPAMGFKLRQSERRMGRALRAQRFLGRGSSFRPRGTELVFDDAREAALPALRVATPKGRTAVVRGRIDRVDVAQVGRNLAAVVLDYKSSRGRRLDLAEVLHGLALQLLSYLLVLQDHGERWVGEPLLPVGVFYSPVLGGMRSVACVEPAHDEEAFQAGPFKPRGVFDAGFLKQLDSEAGSGRSQRYAAFVKKDGSVGHMDTTDVASRPQLERLLDHVRQQIGRLADAILEGEIGVYPVRLGEWVPCRWCPYGAVCRIEPLMANVRELAKLTRGEVLDQLGASGRGAGDG
ncbi:MAG TPA: PD-(D/E)XK nuclease family protein [Phycisphaerae bacterium]|nr:PD-(D/E)XK nuclease family protein [Phycisphaerae bacterium]